LKYISVFKEKFYDKKMKTIYRVYAKISTTKKGEQVAHDVSKNNYPILQSQTKFYVEQLRDFHTEQFDKRKSKELEAIVTITIREKK
jgi:hypothetical protein